jgi:hypothetical protein
MRLSPQVDPYWLIPDWFNNNQRDLGHLFFRLFVRNQSAALIITTSRANDVRGHQCRALWATGELQRSQKVVTAATARTPLRLPPFGNCHGSLPIDVNCIMENSCARRDPAFARFTVTAGAVGICFGNGNGIPFGKQLSSNAVLKLFATTITVHKDTYLRRQSA